MTIHSFVLNFFIYYNIYFYVPYNSYRQFINSHRMSVMSGGIFVKLPDISTISKAFLNNFLALPFKYLFTYLFFFY